MKNLSLLLLGILFIWACKNEKTAITMRMPQKPLSSIVLKDSFQNKLQKDTFSRYDMIFPSLLYIGKMSDTVILSYNKKWENFGKEEKRFPYEPDSNEVEIFVDTTRFVGNGTSIPKGYRWHARGELICYPVFVRNNSKDTFDIGAANYMSVIIEAQLSTKEWVEIQKYPAFCGNGLVHNFLPPQYLAVGTCKIYKGDYKSKLRMKIAYWDHAFYSNEFWGDVYMSQINHVERTNFVE